MSVGPHSGSGAVLLSLAIGFAPAIGCGGGAGATGNKPDGGSTAVGGSPGGSSGSGGVGGNSLPSGLTVLAGVPGGVGQRDDVGRAARIAQPGGLADDGQGHIYIADSGAATIRKLDLATGALTTLAGTPIYLNRPIPGSDGVGAAAQFRNPTDITFAGGSLYVADANQVRRIDPTTGAVTTIAGEGTASASAITYTQFIAADNQGNLFVDVNRHQIVKIAIATGQVTPVVGTADSTDFIDGVGAAGHIAEPRALALDGNGALYVLDGGSVRRIDLATATLTTLPVGPTGLGHHVAGMASDHAGHLYLSDLYFDVVYRVTLASGELVSLAGADNVAGSEDGLPPAGHLNFPTSMIVGSSGAIYLSDRDNATVRQIDVTTGALTTLAGQAPHTGATDGARDVARFKTPLGISADAAGNVFVADTRNFSIRRLNVATGAVTTVAGDPNQSGAADGVGPAAKFIEPIGVAVGPAGTLFTVDDLAFNVRRIDLATAAVTTIAGKAGEIGGADGPGSMARFWTPVGITYDGAGTGAVLVTDANAAIRRIDMVTGNVSTSVILPMLPTGGYALFNPVGVVSDGGGNAYVVDADQHTISRVVLATGEVSLLAGSRNEPGATDGVGTAARFNGPRGVAYDGRGHLFVTEPDNHVVRRVTIDTGEVTTVVGLASERGVKTGPLPGRLNSPYGIAVLPSGDLVISDRAENVILLAH